MSWDHEGMISQEDRGFEPVLELFTLHPYDFTLLQQAMRHFAPLPYLSCSQLDFVLSLLNSAKFHTTTQFQCEISERLENRKFCVPSLRV